MKAFNNIALLIILFGAFLAFFSTLVVFRLKHGNLKANRFFSLLLFTTMVFLVRGFFLLSGLYTVCPLVVELADNVRYFIFPALYFYIQTVSNPDFRFQKYDVVQLLPLIFNLLVKWKFYFSDNADQIRFVSQWLDGSVLQPGFYWDSVSRVVFFIYNCSYIFLSIRTYRRNKEKVRQAFPFGEIHWSWIRILTFSLLPCLLVCLSCIPFLMAGHPIRFFFCFLNLTIALVVFFCTFKVFSRPEILYAARPLKCEKKYDHSKLNTRDYQAYFNRLKQFMEYQEGYLDPDLTLTGLAQTLSIPRNDLSRIINEKTGKTFNDFINSYRVEKFKKLLNHPENQSETLLSLAFQVGFNSKTPFNAAFKKMTGESPIAYRKKLRNMNFPPRVCSTPQATTPVASSRR
jgi:AraC-like DNA-binding protein